MNKITSIALAASVLLATGTASYAHHSFSMFDSSQEVVVEGTVVRWAFTSPHSFMMIEDADGQVWAFEGSAPPALLGQTPPMTGNTFKVGDEITVIQCPLRDGRPGGAAGLIIAADGTVYIPADGGCRGASQRMDVWPEWIAAGYKSKAEAEAATGVAEEPAEEAEEAEEPAEAGDEAAAE